MRTLAFGLAALLVLSCGASQSLSGSRTATLDPATLVATCVNAHKMNGPDETLTSLRSRPVKGVTTSRHCEWPARSYTAADGYSEVVVTGYLWEDNPEVTGASNPDVLASACAEIEVAYTFQKQGPSSPTSVRVEPGAIVDIFGKPWPPPGSAEVFPFPHGPKDAVVVHNSSYSLTNARCVR